MEVSKLETNISSPDPKRLTAFYRDVVGVPFNTE